MSNELQMGNSSQDVTQNGNLRAKDMASPHVNVILPDYKEEVSVGNLVLYIEYLTLNRDLCQYK